MLGVVGTPFRREERVWEALLECWEWSGRPSGGQGEVGRPFQRVGRVREALLEGLEGSGGPPE